MNLQRLQQKLIRRLTSPMEYLHAITSHWVIILVIAIGVAAGVAVKVFREPPIYDAIASLILTPPENHMLVRPDKTPRVGSSRTRNRDFLAEQMGVLQSASVYRLVVTTLGYDKRALNAAEETADVSALEEVYEELKGRIVDFLQDESAEVLLDSPDVRLKAAMDRFAKRVFVNPEEKSRQVGLRIYGGNPAVLERELETWIEAYRRVLKRLSDENSLQLENHIASWTAMSKITAEKLEQFRNENPDVRQSLLDAAKDNLIDQRSYVRQLQSQILLRTNQDPEDDKPPVTNFRFQNVPPSPKARGVDEDPTIQAMERTIAGLKLRRVGDLSKYGPKSYVIRKLDELVSSHEEELGRMRGEFLGVLAADEEDAPVEDGVATPAPKRRKTTAERLQDAVSFAKREERKAQREVERLEGKLATFNELKAGHDVTLQKKQKYEEYKSFMNDAAKSSQTITVRILDKPTASALPVNHEKFIKVALGGVGGLLGGFLLALTAEVFCRTVRFKKDVIEEFELEVVGVLPEK